jgi:predicted nucleic acid-binding protein
MQSGTKRVYVDASVVGGMFDGSSKRRRQTREFWDAVRNGEFIVIASDLLTDELTKAPKHVQDFFDELPEPQVERIISTDESDDLAAHYIGAKVVREKPE